MKLSELRVCDSCHSVLAPQGLFYVLRCSLAMVKGQAFQQVAGLITLYGGALALAEVMAPDAEVVLVAGDEEPALMTEFLICQTCYLSRPIDLALMAEAEAARRQRLAESEPRETNA